MDVNKVISVFINTEVSDPHQVRHLLDEMLCWMVESERENKSIRQDIESLKVLTTPTEFKLSRFI